MINWTQIRDYGGNWQVFRSAGAVGARRRRNGQKRGPEWKDMFGKRKTYWMRRNPASTAALERAGGVWGGRQKGLRQKGRAARIVPGKRWPLEISATVGLEAVARSKSDRRPRRSWIEGVTRIGAKTNVDRSGGSKGQNDPWRSQMHRARS